MSNNSCCSPESQNSCCDASDKTACCGADNSTCGCATTTQSSALPTAIIGAGPVGLAAAAQLIARNEPFVLIEAGPAAGASITRWGHVRLFSPWRYCIDRASERLLQASGWRAPDPEAFPTGDELVRGYLAPLAALPQIQAHLRVGTRVTTVTRNGVDKLKTAGRVQAPFKLSLLSTDGGESELLAKAVIDASGTYEQPNPLGAGGVPALGERGAASAIDSHIPDVRGAERARYAGARVLVVGSGHSAFNTVLELDQLAREAPNTRITWAVRRSETGQMFGGGDADALGERGALGSRAARLLNAGHVTLVTGARITRVTRDSDGVTVTTDDGRTLGPFDRIVANTGFRPDLAMLGELRLALDDRNDAPFTLAPLIDPNVHSCGSVPPHGFEELKHPAEPGIYIVGMKSYGRAPTFLMLTGYEQVRSVTAAIAGDLAAARDVQLVLPETGVCTTDNGSCCVVPSNVIRLEAIA